MELSVLGVIVFGVGTWICLRIGMRALHALVAVLFGFFLASTAIAPTITSAVSAVFEWVSTWHL